MLENLLNLIKDNSESLIGGNSVIPEEHRGAAIEETASAIIGGLKNEASSGNIGGLMGLLNHGESNIASNPIVGNIILSLANSFSSKFGVNQQTAMNVASTLIPLVVSKLITKTNDPNDQEFDLQGMIQAVSGGGLGGMLGGLFGSSNPDGGSKTFGNLF